MPRISENDLSGQELDLKLDLKILADIGLVGLPNAGKSTLFSVLFNASPKIANYEFTTLVPQLGFVKIDSQKSFVLADLPVLIKGVNIGKGLGFQFLKHIQRCRVIGHVIDFGNNDVDPINSYIQIRNELNNFSSIFSNLNEIIIVNKNDQPYFY